MQNNITYFIIIKSNNKILHKNYIYKIENLLKYLNVNNYILKHYSTNISKYTILESPHIHKKFMETFEERTYKSIFTITTTDVVKFTYFKKFLEKKIPLSLNITFKEINTLN